MNITNNIDVTEDIALPTHHPLAGLEADIDQLRACGRLFHQRGWSVGTSSNYSVVINKDPIELIVTASGKDKGNLHRSDFVRIDSTGKPSSPDQPKSSAETMLHVVLAELPHVGSILHTHSIWGTLLSDHHYSESQSNSAITISGYEMLKGLEGIDTHATEISIPIFDNTQDIPTLADQVRQQLQQQPESIQHGFLIRNHGLYTWGSDLFTTRRHIEIFEFLFEIVGRKTDFRG